MMKKDSMRKRIIFGLTMIIILVLSYVGIKVAYSFYNAHIEKVNETETILKSKKLDLVFNDTKEVNVNSMTPGLTVEKTFDVESNADDPIAYNIKFKDINNTYKNDVVYELLCDGEVVVSETPLPKTNEQEYILANITINPGEKKNYVLKMTYLNMADKLQTVNKNGLFQGTVEIDLAEDVEILVYAPEETKELSSELLSENKIQDVAFTVRNSSHTNNLTYNVLLDDLVNEYDKDELTYSLEKNGEEVVSDKSIPVTGDLNYLITDQKLASGKTDDYTLTVTNTIEDTKTFNANIEVDKKEVDLTAPENSLAYVSKTSNSITYNASCKDPESGIKKYEIYQDGKLVKTIEENIENYEYTFTNLNTKEYEFKLVCTNNFDVITSSIDRRIPNTLIEPTYEVASGYATSKNVDINYTGEGAYLFKVTGTVTSNKEVIDCGESSIDGAYSCTNTTVPVGTQLSENVWYKVSDNPTLTFTSNGTIIAKVADGTNYKSGSSLNVSGIDTESPSAPIITAKLNNASGNTYTSGSWTNQDVYLEVNSTDNVGVIKYQYNEGASWIDLSTNNLTKAVTQTIKFRAIDAAGNISNESNIEIKIDKENPTCSWSGESTTYRTSATIKATCSDTASGCTTDTASKEWSYTTTTTTAALSYTITDNAGNSTTCSKTANVYVDNTQPSCTITGLPGSWTTGATLTVSGSDGHSGLNTAAYSWNGVNYSTTQTKSITANGTYTAYVKDKVGNIKSCSATVSKVDNITPGIIAGGGTVNLFYGASGNTANYFSSFCNGASSGCTTTCNPGNLYDFSRNYNYTRTVTCTIRTGSGKTASASRNFYIYNKSKNTINWLYQKGLERSANPDELESWNNTGNAQGNVLAKCHAIQNGIAFSVEFNNRYTDNRSKVYRYYWIYMGREADSGGWNDNTNWANANGYTSVADAFRGTGENTNFCNSNFNIE